MTITMAAFPSKGDDQVPAQSDGDGGQSAFIVASHVKLPNIICVVLYIVCPRNVVFIVLYRGYSKAVMKAEEMISYHIAWVVYIAAFYGGYIFTCQTMGAMECYRFHAHCYVDYIMGTCRWHYGYYRDYIGLYSQVFFS